MTANELADELGNILTFLEIEYADYEDDEILKQASTMLRQQQAQIQALHNLVKEQEKKIINLAFDLAYANRTDEWLKETDEEVIANAEKRFPFLKSE